MDKPLLVLHCTFMDKLTMWWNQSDGIKTDSPGWRITSFPVAAANSGWVSKSGSDQSIAECRAEGCPIGNKDIFEHWLGWERMKRLSPPSTVTKLRSPNETIRGRYCCCEAKAKTKRCDGGGLHEQ